MKTSLKRIFTLLSVLTLCCAAGCKGDPPPPSGGIEQNPVPIPKTNPINLLVHYMPWYETKETIGRWGMHWTMGNRNPDIIDSNGKRQIASHYYPLIGPYASRDEVVIEYHLLLIKYAGIDGLLINWYGVHDVYDYPDNRINTEAVVKMLGKVGLKFAVVYEDRTLPNVVKYGKASTEVEAAQADMNYLQSNFFSLANYFRIAGDPLLMVFGPITLQSPGLWTEVFSGLRNTPCFLTLWYESSEAGVNAKGEYAWVYMDNSHLDNFYNNRVHNLQVAFGSAYPGFNDYYSEGGWGERIGWTIDHNNGATLDVTLQKATNAGIDYLQLVTWNDFGEGTIIEPTNEFGFDYLEKIRRFAGITDTLSHFENIHQLYLLRREHKGNAAAQRELDRAFYLFVSMQPELAADALQRVKQEF